MLTDPDALLLRDIVENPGHPVLLSHLPRLMQRAGSALQHDGIASLTGMTGKTSGTVNMNVLDLEYKSGAKKVAQLRRYITWRGATGPVHTGGHANPPESFGVNAFHLLQSLIDKHQRVISARIAGGSLGGAECGWSKRSETAWKKIILPALCGGALFETLNHPLGKDQLNVRGSSSSTREAWVLRRLKSLAASGALDIPRSTEQPGRRQDGTPAEKRKRQDHDTTAVGKRRRGSTGKSAARVRGRGSKRPLHLKGAGKRQKRHQAQIGGINAAAAAICAVEGSNMTPEQKSAVAKLLTVNEEALQLAQRRGAQKVLVEVTAASKKEKDSKAGAKRRLLARKACHISRAALARLEAVRAHQPSAQMAHSEAQAAKKGKKFHSATPKYGAAVNELLPFASEFRAALDTLYPVLTDVSRKEMTVVECLPLPAALALPNHRDGKAWPDTWQDVARARQLAPQNLFKHALTLVQHRVRDKDQNLRAFQYKTSAHAVVRAFVNGHLLGAEGGAFAKVKRQARARRRALCIESTGTGGNIRGRKPKARSIKCAAPDVARTDDVSRCCVGEWYMPEDRVAADPIIRSDLTYDKIFVTEGGPAYGLFGMMSDAQFAATQFGNFDPQSPDYDPYGDIVIGRAFKVMDAAGQPSCARFVGVQEAVLARLIMLGQAGRTYGGLRKKTGNLTLVLSFPSDGGQQAGASAVSLWGRLHVPHTDDNAAVLGRRPDGTWESHLVRQHLSKPWELMTMLRCSENAHLYSNLIGPLMGALIEDAKNRVIRIVNAEHGWDMTVELQLAGGCGLHGDQAVRCKGTGKQSSGLNKCEFAVQNLAAVLSMDWATLDAVHIETTSDLQRESLDRLQAGIPDGVARNGMVSVWPITANDPARSLAERGIDPKATGSVPELLHLRSYGKSFIYNAADYLARTKKQPGETTAPQEQLMARLNEYCDLGAGSSWRESMMSNLSLVTFILFNWEEATSVNGVSLLESGENECAWWAYQLTTIFGGAARDEVYQDEQMVLRINVAAASNFWLTKQMIGARLMTEKEMYDCYCRNTTIYLPHIHGTGFNEEKGVNRYHLSAAHTQSEEQRMAKNRVALKNSTKGGFKPTGHTDEMKTEGMLRELHIQDWAQALVAVQHCTGQGDESSRASLHEGTIAAWIARGDCPLDSDIVIPEEMLRPGTPGAEYITPFLERRKYVKGVHYHRIREVGLAFHTSTPFGVPDDREFASADEFRLPDIVSRKMTAESAWHEHRELKMNGAAVAWKLTTTVRHTVQTAQGREVQEDIKVSRDKEMEDWTTTDIEQQCKELYAAGLALVPSVDLKAQKAGGTGSTGGMLKSDWATVIQRLSRDAQGGGLLCRERHDGSVPGLACAHPVWPASLRFPDYTLRTARRTVRHDVERQRAEAAATEVEARAAAARRDEEANVALAASKLTAVVHEADARKKAWRHSMGVQLEAVLTEMAAEADQLAGAERAATIEAEEQARAAEGAAARLRARERTQVHEGVESGARQYTSRRARVATRACPLGVCGKHHWHLCTHHI